MLCSLFFALTGQLFVFICVGDKPSSLIIFLRLLALQDIGLKVDISWNRRREIVQHCDLCSVWADPDIAGSIKLLYVKA